MSIFIYEAYNTNKEIVKGEYEGVKREEVVDYLVKHDLTPVSIEELHKSKSGILSMQFFERLSTLDIVFLVRNLSTMTKAGLSIVESLDVLVEDTENKLMKKILEEVRVMVKNGQPLSVAFESYAHLFPPIFIGMIKAGEISGQLDKNLFELATYLSKEYDLRNKVKSALTYPIILLVAATSIVTLMLIFVLPKLTKSFAMSGVELPYFTRFFLGLSNILTYSLTLDLVVLGVLFYFFLYFRRTKLGKKFFSWIISHTPVANNLVKKIALVRFTRIFGNLLGGGFSVIESLELSVNSINNQSYVSAIKSSIPLIKNGIAISEALGKYPKLFPRLLISLIVVGERTGTLHDIFNTFANFYDKEVDNKLKDLTSVLEPILLLIMGLMVGSIAFSIILPIYQLIGNFV